MTHIYHYYAIAQVNIETKHMDGVLERMGSIRTLEEYQGVKKAIGAYFSIDPEKITICSLTRI